MLWNRFCFLDRLLDWLLDFRLLYLCLGNWLGYLFYLVLRESLVLRREDLLLRESLVLLREGLLWLIKFV